MGTCAKQDFLAQRWISALIPTQQGDDSSVSALLCRVDKDTVLLGSMGQMGGNRPPVHFHPMPSDLLDG